MIARNSVMVLVLVVVQVFWLAAHLWGLVAGWALWMMTLMRLACLKVRGVEWRCEQAAGAAIFFG